MGKTTADNLTERFSKLSLAFRSMKKEEQIKYQDKIDDAAEKLYSAYKAYNEKMDDFNSDKSILARNFYEGGYKRSSFISPLLKQNHAEEMKDLHEKLEDYDTILDVITDYFLQASSMNKISKIDNMLNRLNQLNDQKFKSIVMQDPFLWKALAETQQPLTSELRADLISLNKAFINRLDEIHGPQSAMFSYWIEIQMDMEKTSNRKLYPIVQNYENQLHALLPSANAEIQNQREEKRIADAAWESEEKTNKVRMETSNARMQRVLNFINPGDKKLNSAQKLNVFLEIAIDVAETAKENLPEKTKEAQQLKEALQTEGVTLNNLLGVQNLNNSLLQNYSSRFFSLFSQQQNSKENHPDHQTSFNNN